MLQYRAAVGRYPALSWPPVSDALTYDDVVGIVLEQFVDRRVYAAVLLPGNPTLPGLMSIRGTLYPSASIEAARARFAGITDDPDELELWVQGHTSGMTEDPDKLKFSFHEHRMFDGFWLDRPRLVSARWLTAEPTPTLAVELLGGVVLRLTDETPDDGEG